MTSISSVRVVTCVVAAALVGAAAATLPAEARAEDGLASVPEAAATTSAIDGAALAGEASAAVEDAAASATELATQAQDPSSIGEPSAPAAPSDAADASVPSESTTSAAPATPSTDVSTPDTAPNQVDTTADTATSAPATPSVAPAVSPGASQAAPSNVNVSVRIGSAGDNGSVTQVNVAAAASVAATVAAGPSTSPATALPPSTASASRSPAASTPATASPSTAEDVEGTWTWQWNCLSAPDLTAISPSDSAGGSVPKNWTWIWNCGSNPDQYQGATAAQYQPSNLNVSIRISSPGNDGPVTQANIAAALGVATSTTTTTTTAVAGAVHASIPSSATQPPSDGPATAVSGISIGPVLPSLPELLAPAGATGLLGDLPGVTIDPSPFSGFDMLELPLVIPGFSSADSFEPGGLGIARLPRLVSPGVAPWFDPATLSPPGLEEQGVEAVEARGATLGEKSGGSRDSREPRPAPRWKAPAPAQPVPASLTSGTSAAPASGGGSSGGGIPIFLALPFLAVMFDLARRVALDRVALPSGHRSRMPENPG